MSKYFAFVLIKSVSFFINIINIESVMLFLLCCGTIYYDGI